MIEKGEESNFKNNEKIILTLLIIGIIIFSLTGITAQVVGTNIIELTEKVRNFFIEATKGNIVGQTTGNKFGQNIAVGSSEEDIQSQGGILIFLQAAELITLSSSSTNDDIDGTNATSVELIGLDGDFKEISEIVNLSGTADVNTTKTFIRINRMKVNEVGNYSVSNAGTITGTAATSGTIQIQIPIGSGQSKTTHFTVPAGQNLIITAFRITMNTGKEVDITAKFRENANDIIPPVSPVKIIRDVRGLSTPVAGTSLGNLKFNEKTDIWFTAITSAGATSVIEINYDFVQYAIGT